jgi:hypothetical protein
MKEIERAITTRNANLQGVTINPKAIIDTIPHTNTVNAGINIARASTPAVHSNVPRLQPQITEPIIANDPNQMEFDFNNTNYAKLIFDRLDSIDRRLATLDAQSKS